MYASKLAVMLFSVTSCWAGSWKTEFDEWRFPANQNDTETITQEVNEALANPAASRRLWDADRSPSVAAEVGLISDYDPRLVFLRLHSERETDADLVKIGKKISQYVRLRLKGHTAGYAHWVSFSGLNQPSAESAKKYLFLKTAIDEIAIPWVPRDLRKLFVYSTANREAYLLVVDGELAWIYTRIISKPDLFAVERIDATEFGKATSGAFASMEEEWKAEAKAKGLRVNDELQKWAFSSVRLREKYGIDWRPPWALNPGKIYH